MYLEFFGLKEYPFQLTPDSEFLYMSPAHTRAMAYMDYAVWNRDGFVVITGEVGSGKTTLIQKLLSDLGESVLTARIFQTQLDETEFLQAMLVEFGLNPFNAKKVELLDMLNTFLVDSFLNLRQIVLIVDDAHNLNMKVLEEICMLSGLETQKEKILHVVLVGQPELNDVLDSPEMEQLAQRVRLRYHIKALSQEVIRNYVIHRLQIAGLRKPGIIASNAFPVIYKYTGGIPRLINTLCDTAMTCAYADNIRTVSADIVNNAVGELQWVSYAQRVKAYQAKRDTRRDNGSRDLLSGNGKTVDDIDNKLNQLTSISPALSVLGEKMTNIEILLKEIVGAIHARRQSSEGLDKQNPKRAK